MIPKIIHYCWFSNDRYPQKVSECIEGWRKLMPDWEIKEWNLKNFDLNTSNITKECWADGTTVKRLEEYTAFRSLYMEGGIFLNPYIKLKEPLTTLLNNKVFFEFNSEKEIGLDIIGAEPKNIVIGNILDIYNQLHFSLEDTANYAFNYLKSNYNLESNSRFVVYSEGCNNLIISRKTFPDIKVSVVMPVWNGENYIKQAIDSVLSQNIDDIELIIVNDGSTDNTENIIKSCGNNKIKLITTEHKGISFALNLGIKHCSGYYIARMDADDIMLPGRLKKQIDILEKNPEIDILGTGYEYCNTSGKRLGEYFVPNPTNTYLTKELFLKYGNLIAHPTVMFRGKSIKKLSYPYESYYNGSEDFKLWIKCLDLGMKLQNIPDPTIIYRQQEKQDNIISKRIINSYTRKNNNDTELSCIIPFKNEGVEIEKTVASIRATSNCNIILVDDCSDDNYNYKNVSDRFGCSYFKSTSPLGVAGGRNLGVNLCNTEYFVLLDGHMRFYDDDWDIRLLKHLKEHNRAIITSNSSVMSKLDDEDYVNEDGKDPNKLHGSFAARVNFNEPGWEFSGKWTSKTDIKDYPDNLSQCSCVMGAFYATNKTWWNLIGGLKGLVAWGGDEPLMSIKTYLAGGECLILKDFYVGHLYRGKAPYKSWNSDIDSNHIYLINLFAPSHLIPKYIANLKSRLGDIRYRRANDTFYKRYQEFIEFKNHFYSKIAKIGWDDWIKINDKYE